MSEESGRGRIWSPPRLQSAVKAAFFSRAVDVGKTEDLIRLRYSDIKRGIAGTEGPVGDKSLSNALRALTGKGYLVRRRQGREVFYQLRIPRSDRVSAFAKSDSVGIQSAATTGGIGDLTEGWAFYGLPDAVREELRKPLRRAALGFQRQIVRALDRLGGTFLDRAFRKARRSLSPREIRLVDKAFRHVLELQLSGATAMIRGELAWKNLEAVIPGSLTAWRRALGIPSDLPPISQGWTDVHSDSLAKAVGIPPSELRRLVAAEREKLERLGPVLAKFFRAQGKVGAERLGRDLDALVTAAITLTSVIRT